MLMAPAREVLDLLDHLFFFFFLLNRFWETRSTSMWRPMAMGHVSPIYICTMPYHQTWCGDGSTRSPQRPTLPTRRGRSAPTPATTCTVVWESALAMAARWKRTCWSAAIPVSGPIAISPTVSLATTASLVQSAFCFMHAVHFCVSYLIYIFYQMKFYLLIFTF